MTTQEMVVNSTPTGLICKETPSVVLFSPTELLTPTATLPPRFSTGTSMYTRFPPVALGINRISISFVGNGQFCFKACFNSVTKPDYCENRYDLVGCQYNMPSAAKDGEFTECDSDLQDVVGTYVVNGVSEYSILLFAYPLSRG